jgi:twitching motility protein PilT
MSLLEHLLAHTAQVGASDLHMQAGGRPRIRLQGELIELEDEVVLEEAQLESRLLEGLDEEQRRLLGEQGFLDFSRRTKDAAWRVHYYRQQLGLAAAFRPLPPKVPSLDELNLPGQIERLAHLRSGLVLVTGATGSGKSSTLAALVNVINRDYRRTILTLEDPIEFDFVSDRSAVQQRAIGRDVGSFARGVQDALLQHPDVLMVGELRDYETARAALLAAEAGMLVYSTLHSNDTGQSIDRFLDLFPFDEQPLTRVLLAQSLQGIVSQVLLHAPEGKERLPACELLFRTPAIAALIRDDKIHEVKSCLQTGGATGMILLDDALDDLVNQGKISAQEAARHARTPERFHRRHSPRGPVRSALRRLMTREEPETKDRRHEPRVRSLNLVNVEEQDQVGRPVELTPGRTLDLSHDGMRIELSHALLLRERVHVHLALENQVVEVHGEVRSVEEIEGDEDGRCRVGIRFTRLSDEDRRALDLFLDLI